MDGHDTHGHDEFILGLLALVARWRTVGPKQAVLVNFTLKIFLALEAL